MMRDAALKYIYAEKRKAKIALGQAENRPGVTQDELEALETKIAVLEWLEPLALNAEEE